MASIIDFIFHFDKFLGPWIHNYGTFVYFFLFLIIFIETGLVIMPFLPGDSLIFAAGAFASQGILNIWVLFIFLTLAAIFGDTMNYLIGNIFGERIFLKKNLIKKEYLDKTYEFFKKHGGKTVILARFVPIIRTIAPFVAGVGKMNYSRFLFFNIIGGILWTALFLFAGYLFGNIPFVKDNLGWFIILIIVISILPILIRIMKKRTTLH